MLNLFEDIAGDPGEVRDFHVCSLNKGAVRGNHYHTNGEEHILFLGGNYRIATQDIESGRKEERLFEEPDGRLVKIDRNLAHAIKNEGEAPLYLLCFYVSTDHVQVETVRHLLV